MNRRTLAIAAIALFAVPAVALASPANGACGGAVPLSATTLDSLGLAPDPEIHACIGKIQPGALMTSPAGCTMNWVFVDETGALYIGTAGHCIGASGSNGRSVSVQGVGVIGTSVYNINAGIGNDFALVKIDPSKYGLVDPTLCHWGGPTHQADFPGGPITANPDERTLLQYGFGWATSASSASRARVQVATSWSSASISTMGLVTGGDSGSPTMFEDGGAAGIITHGTVGTPFGGAGPGFAQRIDRGLALASAATGRTYTLVTSDVPVTLTGA